MGNPPFMCQKVTINPCEWQLRSSGPDAGRPYTTKTGGLVFPIEEIKTLCIYTRNGADSTCEAKPGFQRWHLSYIMRVPYGFPNRDLLRFNKAIENELIRIIKDETITLGPIKFSYAMLVKLKKIHKKRQRKNRKFL